MQLELKNKEQMVKTQKVIEVIIRKADNLWTF